MIAIHRHVHERGVTFFEVLVVLGMLLLIGSLALLVSMETYRGSQFRADRAVLVAALQRARAQAINNMCIGAGCTDGKPHGIKILPKTVVVFQGESYVGRDAPIDVSFGINSSVAGADEVVFSQLSGTTTCGSGCTMRIDDGGHLSYATTTAEGRIYWSN